MKLRFWLALVAMVVAEFGLLGSLHAMPPRTPPITYATTGAGDILAFEGPESYTVFASGLNNPGGMAIDRKGNLYVAENGANRILKFSASNTFSVYGYVNTPASVALDGCGNLFVTSVLDGTVTMFTSAMQSTVYASGLNYPVGIALDQQQQVFVSQFADEIQGSIMKLADNGTSSVFASGLRSVRAFSFDSEGHLYLTEDSNNGSVSVYTAPDTGNVILSGLNYPFGVFVSPSDSLFVLSPSSISTFALDGSSGASFASGLFYPNHIAWETPLKRHNYCAHRK